MVIDFLHKNIVITGGSGGIGRACARLFSELNANVIITYKSEEHFEEAEKLIKELNPHHKHGLFQLNITEADAVESFFNAYKKEYNRLDVLVNNAGVFIEHKIKDLSYQQWQQRWNETIATNLTGVANLCYFAARQMAEQKEGKIINISSRGAFRGEPDHPAYGASKAGLNALSQSLAVALAGDNITVGVIAPGFVETGMVTDLLNSDAGVLIKKQSPMNRVAKPEEVARLVAIFASQGFEYMTGGIIDLNGASYLRT